MAGETAGPGAHACCNRATPPAPSRAPARRSRPPPGPSAGRFLAVRALLALHDTRGAAELVPGLPDTAEGLELKGNVAQALGQWDLALEFYNRLPADAPRRCELIAARGGSCA